MAAYGARSASLTPMPLYHFSEEPGITRFAPRRAPSSALDDELVWAIDEWHQVMYFFPRDCPRACFWPAGFTTSHDRERFMCRADARMVIAVEWAWLDRIRTTTLYRYTMPHEPFERVSDDDSGHWVSRTPVEPLAGETMHDLLAAIASAGVELRVTPSLIELWKAVIQSTMEFSGTRLRNAQGWDAVDWSAIPLGPAARPR